jgi:hypothetical protein
MKLKNTDDEQDRLLTFQLASVAIALAVMATCLFTQRHPSAVARIANVVIAVNALNGQEGLTQLSGAAGRP